MNKGTEELPRVFQPTLTEQEIRFIGTAMNIMAFHITESLEARIVGSFSMAALNDRLGTQEQVDILNSINMKVALALGYQECELCGNFHPEGADHGED